MTTATETTDYITASEVQSIAPGMTPKLLAQLRYKGTGPKYLAPTPRKIYYRRADVIAWLEASERTITGDGA